MLGVLGGVGPAAGSDLFKKIIEETKAYSDQEHLPVALYSLPGRIEDRTGFLEGEVKVNPGIEMARICMEMEKAGVTTLGIPCNTAHSPKIFDKIKEQLRNEASQLKVIHLIEENISFLKNLFQPQTKIGVLSTNGTYEQKLYQIKIEEAGFQCILPKEDLQRDLVHNAIYHYSYGIKSTGAKITELARAQLHHVMDLMKEQQVEGIILGCTELPLALTTSEYRNILLIDATRVLARALIREYDPTKLKPFG
ncbi:aspartate/glutamate racemase family protein [Xanthovirga aplysinae]|uniref:aspartate/glutamate racemase family protein n=1 Tax=Xanthovirga aplysinae TaxID=2529853 RepID=UPI0012BBEC54|nr:amino acid racemase [Xanthovirga aplysinae]MTI31732.1 aspartate/glutamate racemase family protein [Xanthovirga aplysinae]